MLHDYIIRSTNKESYEETVIYCYENPEYISYGYDDIKDMLCDWRWGNQEHKLVS